MQLSKSYILFLVTVMLLSVGQVRADYPVGKRRTAINGTFNYFYSNKYFDANGKLTNNFPGNYFQSTFYSLNITHGLSRRIDLTATLPFAKQTLVNGNNAESRSGITDVNVGSSFHFPSVS